MFGWFTRDKLLHVRVSKLVVQESRHHQRLTAIETDGKKGSRERDRRGSGLQQRVRVGNSAVRSKITTLRGALQRPCILLGGTAFYHGLFLSVRPVPETSAPHMTRPGSPNFSSCGIGRLVVVALGFLITADSSSVF